MRFLQIDHISQLEPGAFIEATKSLEGSEDYLRDHFPRFAVMPGVLMLEALFQASAFLVRETEQHEAGLVVLRAAKNVKFADFMQPGDTLSIRSEIMKQEGKSYTLKAAGKKGESNAVSGRLIVDCVEQDVPDSVVQLTARHVKRLAKQLREATIAQ